MDKPTFNREKIISRLEFFHYRYRFNDERIRIFLPLACYLEVKNKGEGLKFSSRIWFGFRDLSLEWNFVIYGVALFVLSYYNWLTLNRGIFVLLGLFVIYFVVCFLKIETMKSIIHKWIEEDS